MIPSNPDSAWNNVFQRAIIAAANFTLSSYRFGFDVAIPVFNSASRHHVSQAVSPDERYATNFSLSHAYLTANITQRVSGI